MYQIKSRLISENIHLFIVGLGGTGSHLSSYLAQLIGNDVRLKSAVKVILIDGDIVEPKNLRNQKFLKSDIGKNKAKVLADRYNAVYNMTNICYIDSYLEGDDDLIEKMKSNVFNIIVGCVDNNKARRIMERTFNDNFLRNTIYIDTGNSSGQEEFIGQTVIGYKESNQIIFPSVGYFFPLEDEQEEELSCTDNIAENIQNIGANFTSALTVFNILNNILGFKRIPGQLFTFNATNLTAENVNVNPSLLD